MKKVVSTLLLAIFALATANAVTFNVTVPEGTKACFIAGDFNGWDATNAVEMSPSGANTFTLTLDNVTNAAAEVGYKYLCGQDWAYVEKGPSGEELGNRTSVGAMDVVASWAKLYNPDIFETKLEVNGYTRIVKVLLPADYQNSNQSYPVVYMTGVQARYDKAGDDSDRGDDHMGDASWNVPGMVKGSASPCIFVSMYGFVAENIPYEYADFAGSGAADDFINGIEKSLIPYINSRYRTKTGPANTSIVGADLGGLFSVYAALKRPDLFGQCAALSPTIWLNKSEIISLAASAEASAAQRFYLSVGGNEPSQIKSDVADLEAALAARSNADVRFTTFAGATHNDVAWGAAFKSIYPFLLSADATYAGRNAVGAQPLASDFSTAPYSYLSAVDSQNLDYDSSVEFSYVDKYLHEGSERPARVAIVEIPASIKTQYYWNVARSGNGTGDLLKSTNGNVGFSSKKTNTSWLRIVIFEDETVKDIAANSGAFRVVCGSSETMMTPGNNHTASASVNFGSEKSFKIYFGSVNSGSKQSSLTEAISVSDNCTNATIVYDFVTNKVSVTESGQGESGDDNPTTGDLASTSYSIVSAIDSESLSYDSKSKFTYITNFVSSETEVPAQVTIVEIPASVKTQFYWNVARSGNGTGDLLKSTNGNVSFSSKKTTTSWLRVAVLEGETVKDVAANSTAFRLATASASTIMSIAGSYTVTASAEFTGEDKSFTIHFGSVNSGSDMGAITGTYRVSENCTAADISYNFLTNSVAINETNWGETISNVAIDKFIAVPSFCNAGANTKVMLEIADAADINPSVTVSLNYGTPSQKSLTKESDGKWSLNLSSLQAGIYHISLNLQRGTTSIADYKTIAVKVLTDANEEKTIVNPYDGIDWATINQFKSNFHTHTTQSFDANLRVNETVDRYYNAGYKILALTDHDANPYPWEMFSLFNPQASSRNPAALDMLAIPGNELSKSYANSWNEVGGSEFNHHNDFFTGRQGQEFATLRESYAYTEKLGGMQLINHPGQYWNLSKSYTPGEKNSPEWHAENFMTYSSLIGLEVYNQGNRRPNDRILWDQILDITMRENVAVWGYSCDDMHNNEQLFRNYNFMLMPELTTEALKDAMRNGTHYFCYEPSGSGQAKAPRINAINIDEANCTLSIDTDATEVYWISSTDISDYNSPSTRKSTVLAVGKEFDYTGFQGLYVRALLVNEYGETCTQPFGFTSEDTGIDDAEIDAVELVNIYPNPATDIVNLKATSLIKSVDVYNIMGQPIMHLDDINANTTTLNVSALPTGHYLLSVTTLGATNTQINNTTHTLHLLKH